MIIIITIITDCRKCSILFTRKFSLLFVSVYYQSVGSGSKLFHEQTDYLVAGKGLPLYMTTSFDDQPHRRGRADSPEIATLTTKLLMPTCRQRTMERTRLSEKLNEGLSCKLTLLCSPAGYGKTTLVSDWARLSGFAACWVSIDPGDDHPVRFWRYFAAAIDTLQPGLSRKIESILEAPHDGMESVVVALINETERASEPLIVVLDDFHVIQNEAVLRSLGYFIHYMPPHVHLFLTSRTEPGIPLSRLESQGNLIRVNAADLRFDESEGAYFFRECMNLPLSEHESALLVQRTEGWIAMMKLAALSAARYEGASALATLSSGNCRKLDLYMFEEIFSSMSGPMRDFVMKCSVLKRMNGSLCEAVTGRADSGAMLEKLNAAQLFVVPLDEDREWYRFHHLFSGFLLRMLHQEESLAIGRLYEKAGAWCESRGFGEEAIGYYLSGTRHEPPVSSPEVIAGGSLISVLFAGDESRWRERLGGLLKGRGGIGTLLFVPSIEAAYAVLLQEPVQVLLMDAALNDCRDSAYHSILDMTIRFPDVKVMIVSVSDQDEEAMFEAFLHGAIGCYNENNIGLLADEIVLAVRTGRSPNGDRLRKMMVEKKKRLIGAKDIELLHMILQGMTQQQIAQSNLVSLDAVKKRIRRLLGKLNWHLPSKELARRCKLLGLLDP